MKNDGYALITGASRGLGMAFARALAERHCNLVLVARSPEPLRAFANELRRAHPVSVVSIQVDLSIAGAGQILAEQLSRGGIPIELLVNNAGFGLRGEFRANSLSRQLEMLRLNNQAIVELIYSLLPGMLERGQKGIINISSTAGFQPIPFASAFVTVCPGRLHKKQNGDSGQPVKEKWAGICQSTEQVVDETLRVLANGGGLAVPGVINKFSVFAQRLIPRRIVPRLVAKLSKA